VTRYIVRRLILTIPVLFGLLVLVFVLGHILPGSQCAALLGEHATVQACAAFNHAHGYDLPVLVQFQTYLGQIAHGDLGSSIRTSQPVTMLLIQRLPMTLELSLVALLFAISAPLLATFRLRSIPRKAPRLTSELRTLINRDSDAKRVVIDTVEAEPASAESMNMRGGFAVGGFGGTRTPAVVMQFQRFSSLRSFANSDDMKNIASVAQAVGSLPGLVAGGLALTGIGAVLGFIFTLIWIF